MLPVHLSNRSMVRCFKINSNLTLIKKTIDLPAGGSNNNSPNERKIKKATRKNPAIPVLKSGKGIDMPLSDDPVQLELTREQREKMEFADNCEKKMIDIFNQLKIHAQEEGISVSDLSEVLLK